MKKEYEIPEMNIIDISFDDIVVTSGVSFKTQQYEGDVLINKYQDVKQ